MKNPSVIILNSDYGFPILNFRHRFLLILVLTTSYLIHSWLTIQCNLITSIVSNPVTSNISLLIARFKYLIHWNNEHMVHMNTIRILPGIAQEQLKCTYKNAHPHIHLQYVTIGFKQMSQLVINMLCM